MPKCFEDLRLLCRQLKNKDISMQHKLMLYFMSVISVFICIVLLVLAATGVFSFSRQRLNQALSISLDNAAENITEQFDYLSAQGIKLSDMACSEIEYSLKDEDYLFEELNNNPKKIEELEQLLYHHLSVVLEGSECSGAYIILDVTTNASAENAESSRSGLYVRRTNLNNSKTTTGSTTLFRGVKEVARKNSIELHNRWHMEFDSDKIPYYSELKAAPLSERKDSYIWAKKRSLTDTWENIMLLIVPITGSRGEFYGVCGVEISELYFRLAYPSQNSDFGTAVTVLAPRKNDSFYPAEGLCGSANNRNLSKEILTLKKNKPYYLYTSKTEKYIGAFKNVKLSESSVSDTNWTAAVLIPESNYKKHTERNKIILTAVFILLLIIMLILSAFLSRRYVHPITKRLREIQTGNISSKSKTGLSEIDELMNFLQTQKNVSAGIPEGIQEIFDGFIRRTKKLTNSEYNILEYYIDGYEIMEIPDLAYISINTVRRHNRSIYEKLEVASKDELMLYIDLLRRCGRLDEIKRDLTN